MLDLLNYFLALVPIAGIGGGMYYYLRRKGLRIDLQDIPLYLGIGVVTALLAFWIETHLSSYIPLADTLWITLTEAFLITAGVEELCKWIGAYFSTVRYRRAEHILIMIFRFLLIGMGFALLENLGYAQAHSYETSLVRSLTAVPSHACYAILMGALAAKYSYESKRAIFLILSLVIPWIAHGLYDSFIIQNYSEYLLLGAPIVLILFIALSIWIIRHSSSHPVEPSQSLT